MTRIAATVLADVRAYQPCTDVRRLLKEWKGLRDLVLELEECGALGETIPDVLAVFERQPQARTVSWAWEIEYALYRCPGRFEAPLVESARRCPSDFTIRVFGRIRARGRPELGVNVEGLLRSIASRADIPGSLRQLAAAALQYPDWLTSA